MYGTKGYGLRGGTFKTGGAAYYSYGPLTLDFEKVRYAQDLAVSGEVVWDRGEKRYSATLRVSGARRGRLAISWPSEQNAVAEIRGRLGGRVVRLRTPAP